MQIKSENGPNERTVLLTPPAFIRGPGVYSRCVY